MRGPDSQKNGNANAQGSRPPRFGPGNDGLRPAAVPAVITAAMAKLADPLAAGLNRLFPELPGRRRGGAARRGGGIPQFCGSLTTRGWYAMPAGTGTEWP